MSSEDLTSPYDVPEAQVDLLRRIIDDAARDDRFPSVAALRARLDEEPWLVDDLVRGGLAQRVHPDFLVPSIAGLRAAQTPGAMALLRDAEKLYALLRDLYRAEPDRKWLASEIAERIQLDKHLVGRLLAHLLASTDFLLTRAWTLDKMTGGPSDLTLSEHVLAQDPFQVSTQAEALDEPGPVSLTARDFRTLEQVAWSPEGVCLVAGPNGSGKTTLLEAFAFLCDAFHWGVRGAVRMQRGAAGLRRLGASGPPEVVVGLKLGDLSWELRLSVNGGAVGEYPGESVRLGTQVLVRRAAYAPEWYVGRERRGPDAEAEEGRTCLRAAWEARADPRLAPLVRVLRGFRYYKSYALSVLHDGGTGGEADAILEPAGQNLFVVLRNWKTAPRRFRGQFDWVIRRVQQAFPGMLDDIEFDPPVGQVVPARFFTSGSRAALPMSRAADGLLVGLLHLSAVAGAAEGSVIAIDEMENYLHPHAIRALLAAMRELAEERRLTILLTTHSPVLMNAFQDHPDQFFVMEPGRDVLPVSLDRIHDPEWLAHFALGDLYDRMEFGAPPSGKGS